MAHEFVLNVFVNVFDYFGQNMKTVGPDVSVLPHVGTHSLVDVVARMNQNYLGK